MTKRLIQLARTQFLGLLALLIVLTGGTALAATAAKNSVTSRSIKNGQVRTVDLAPNAVGTAQVGDGTLTGSDIDESTLGAVPNATRLGGEPASSYLRGTVYKAEAVTDAGTSLGDGTFTKSKACNAGDLLLSGGPASVNPASTVIESFPTPASTTSWTVRINKNGAGDDFTVVILCLDLP